ncbi:MAG: hypothetical protein DWH97_12095 [Planctomycetota bacterium]|nr:MAG: hypothetical protein DWH97_12095 [Planctomycetota bacterium]RLS92940.1 MAG: hypothetical protein DWI12_10285 [Planctomycetota bacterium]
MNAQFFAQSRKHERTTRAFCSRLNHVSHRMCDSYFFAPHVRFLLLRTACAIPTICGEPSRSFRARPSPKNLCSGRSTRVGLVVAERCTLRTTSDEHPIPDLLRLPCEGRTSDEVAYLAEFKAKDKNKL